VNLLCEHSLINAYVEHQRPIEPEFVEEVAIEFQRDEVAPRLKRVHALAPTYIARSCLFRTSAKPFLDFASVQA
jgi:hypothetical protein